MTNSGSCSVCGVKIANPTSWGQHLVGKFHQKKLVAAVELTVRSVGGASTPVQKSKVVEALMKSHPSFFADKKTRSEAIQLAVDHKKLVLSRSGNDTWLSLADRSPSKDMFGAADESTMVMASASRTNATTDDAKSNAAPEQLSMITVYPRQCDVCNLSIPDQGSWELHVKDARHLDMVRVAVQCLSRFASGSELDTLLKETYPGCFGTISSQSEAPKPVAPQDGLDGFQESLRALPSLQTRTPRSGVGALAPTVQQTLQQAIDRAEARRREQRTNGGAHGNKAMGNPLPEAAKESVPAAELHFNHQPTMSTPSNGIPRGVLAPAVQQNLQQAIDRAEARRREQRTSGEAHGNEAYPTVSAGRPSPSMGNPLPEAAKESVPAAELCFKDKPQQIRASFAVQDAVRSTGGVSVPVRKSEVVHLLIKSYPDTFANKKVRSEAIKLAIDRELVVESRTSTDTFLCLVRKDRVIQGSGPPQANLGQALSRSHDAQPQEGETVIGSLKSSSTASPALVKRNAATPEPGKTEDGAQSSICALPSLPTMPVALEDSRVPESRGSWMQCVRSKPRPENVSDPCQQVKRTQIVSSAPNNQPRVPKSTKPPPAKPSAPKQPDKGLAKDQRKPTKKRVVDNRKLPSGKLVDSNAIRQAATRSPTFCCVREVTEKLSRQQKPRHCTPSSRARGTPQQAIDALTNAAPIAVVPKNKYRRQCELCGVVTKTAADWVHHLWEMNHRRVVAMTAEVAEASWEDRFFFADNEEPSCTACASPMVVPDWTQFHNNSYKHFACLCIAGGNSRISRELGAARVPLRYLCCKCFVGGKLGKPRQLCDSPRQNNSNNNKKKKNNCRVKKSTTDWCNCDRCCGLRWWLVCTRFRIQKTESVKVLLPVCSKYLKARGNRLAEQAAMRLVIGRADASAHNAARAHKASNDTLRNSAYAAAGAKFVDRVLMTEVSFKKKKKKASHKPPQTKSHKEQHQGAAGQRPKDARGGAQPICSKKKKK